MEAPYRSRWITPWRWPRWAIETLAAMFLLSPFAYLLSFPPVAYVLLAMGMSQNDVALTIQQLYFPALVLANRYDVIMVVFDWEFQLLTAIFGPMNGSL